MLQVEGLPSMNVRDIGRHLPRTHHQKGWVAKTGKRVKTWTGYWYVYVTDEAGVERRLRRKKVLGKYADLTKGDAEDKLRDEIKGGRPENSKATFEQIARWYLKTNDGRWSKKWRGAVRSMFKYQILPELGSRIAADLRRSDIQQAINAIAAKPNSQSRRMVQKCLTHIRAVFNLAVDDELLHRNPAPPKKIKLPPTRLASERFLTLEECQRLLAVADARYHLILRLFTVLGLRPGELFALRLNDLQPGALRIDQTVKDYRIRDGAKTEGSRTTVPLPADLEADLRTYIRQKKITDILFPNDVGSAVLPDNYLDRRLKRLGVLANIDVVRKTSITKSGKAEEIVTSGLNHQVLRRTTGTHFQMHGQIKDTQALLRHTNASTTLKHYQKTLEKSLIAAVESWDKQLAAKKNQRGIKRQSGRRSKGKEVNR